MDDAAPHPQSAPAQPEPAQAAPAARPGMLQTLQSLWRELPGLVGDRLEILGLELHRAGLALAQILALVVVAAILGLTAWAVLWVGIVAGLMALGLHMALALGAALLLNLLAAWLLLRRVMTLVALLKLPATRRSLTSFPASRVERHPPRHSPAPAPAPSTEPRAHEHHHSASAQPAARAS